MARLTVTCDHTNGLARCAVWQGKALCDLYVDRLAAPDMTGAVVTGKVVRTARGGQAGWVEAGLPEKIYLESKTPLKSGEAVTVRILSTLGQGKAWSGALARQGEDAPAPSPWQRALHDLGPQDQVTLTFGVREDFAAFEASSFAQRTGLKATLSLKEPVHPELDEEVDRLLDPVVPLGRGATLVIEPTQALVAIDVNSGDVAANATALNLQAVREAARQIRLRNLAGLIVIDCLKMAARADVSKVLNAFARVAESDPCKVNLFGMSKPGLLEATRTRRGPSLRELLGKSEGA